MVYYLLHPLNPKSYALYPKLYTVNAQACCSAEDPGGFGDQGAEPRAEGQWEGGED